MKNVLLLLMLISLSEIAQSQTNVTETLKSDRKIIEIQKIIDLNPQQESIVRDAFDTYSTLADSIFFNVSDPTKASDLSYNANKIFHDKFMGILTNAQRNRYIQVTSAPEINAKVNYKLSLLKGTNEYSSQETEKMRKEMFDYLMLEKVVYIRDKFNFQKQKENIRKLKQYEPTSIKESNSREKIKAQGKMNRGNITW